MSLLNKASLVLTPNAVKENKLYSIIPTNGDGDLDVVRATTATRVNSSGLIEVVPYNLLLRSEEFDNASWTKNAGGTGVIPLVTSNTVISPNGSQDADTIVFDRGIGNTISDQSFIQQLISVTDGSKTLSIFVKATTINDVGKEIFLRVAGAAGLYPYTLTANWVRIQRTDVVPSTLIQIGIRGVITTGNSVSVDVWGAQLVTGTDPKEYFPTTDRLNVPRLDYTNSTCPSILVEPQRTNVILQSSDLSQSVWYKTNYALSSTTSIQGLTATRITKNATNNGVYNGSGGRNLVNIIGSFASGTKTLSFLIRKGNTDKVGFVINNVLVGALTSVICEFNFNTKTFTNVSAGLSVSYENPTTDVYKIILTINDIGVSPSKTFWIAPVNDSKNTVDGGYLDFAYAQWELGANATSYIPTVASAVTRNADVISKTGIADLINSEEGSFYVEASSFVNGGSFRLFSLSDGTSNNRISIGWSLIENRLLVFMNIGGTIRVNDNIIPFAQTSNNKVLFRWGSGNFNVFVNGVNRLSLTSVTMPTANLFNKLGFDLGSSASFFEGNVKSVLVFPTQLTDEQCILLTGDTYNSYSEMASNLNYILQ